MITGTKNRVFLTALMCSDDHLRKKLYPKRLSPLNIDQLLPGVVSVVQVEAGARR